MRPAPDLVGEIRREVAEELSARRVDDRSRHDGHHESHDEGLVTDLIRAALDRRARGAVASGQPFLDVDDEDELASAVRDALFGLGGIQPYLEDPSITDIHAQGCDQVFVVHDDGRKQQVPPVASTDAELVGLLRRAAARMGRSERRFDAAHPELNLRLPDGSRLFAVMNVSARPSVAIRRHRLKRVFLEQLVELGTLDRTLAEFLAAAVRARKNIVVGGGTSMGKTTLLRALLNEVPPHERIITAEDSLELGLDQFSDLHPDVVTLEAREPNVEGQGAIPLDRLVRMGLRMDPDRVIVGEVRGDEILPMLNAMSQGNDGSMCTVHAHSSAAVFRKLAMYAMQTPQRLPIEATNLLVANAVHFVIHLGRDHSGQQRGSRFATSLREVVDADGQLVVTNEVFRPGPAGRAVPGVPPRAATLEELVAAGFDPVLLHSPGTRG